MDQEIAAILPTYNRKELLYQCIISIFNQKEKVNSIFIIDNASTDGTENFLLEKGLLRKTSDIKSSEIITEIEETKIYYIKLKNNIGSAGGFYEGIKRAYKKNYKWFWLMDDDSEPTPDCLKNLFESYYYIKSNYNLKIGFICSKVLYKDNKPHYMNIPEIKPLINNYPFHYIDNSNIIIINSCSFVSLLIDSKVIEEVGLPLKELFIYGDDVEYTKRIISKGFLGFLCLNSIIYHKTKNNDLKTNLNFKRLILKVRNNLYIYRRFEPLKYPIVFLYRLYQTIKYLTSGNIKYFYAYLLGIALSLFFNPKITFLKNEHDL